MLSIPGNPYFIISDTRPGNETELLFELGTMGVAADTVPKMGRAGLAINLNVSFV